jgi:hypothetical protein
VWRAGAVAAVILAVVGSLVLVAMDQARRADRNARQEALQRRQGEQLLYVAHMNLARQAWEMGNIGRGSPSSRWLPPKTRAG